LLWERSCK